MADPGGPSKQAGFWRRPNTDPLKTLTIAGIVALTCGVGVSGTAVVLRPVIDANADSQRQQRMAAMLQDLPGIGEILREAGAEAVETLVIDLETGERANDTDPASYNRLVLLADPLLSTPLDKSEDLARLGTRENAAPVYLVRREGALALVVLPMRGMGYGGMISAYLALEADLNTVAALAIFEQSETPGLGGRTAEPSWQAQWAGKQVTSQGDVMIEVVRGVAREPYEVDGISGATITGRSVSGMLQFWLGPRGFGPFIDRLREEQAS